MKDRHTFLRNLSKYWFYKAFSVIFLLVMACAGFAQSSVFVSSSAADDTGDGLSWETAKKTIPAALTLVAGNGIVFVKAGDYSTTAEFTVPAGVTIMGGYQQSSVGTDTTQRRLPGVNSHWTDNTWCSIITGAGNHRIATVNGVLDGCVVRNGFSSTLGGGLLIDGGTVRYCIIKECDAIDDDDNAARGGGAYVRNNGILLNSVITECRADNGVGVAGEDGSLINNTITRNAPIGCGYAVDVDGNYYDAVLIGTQCWLKQNLRVTHFPDSNAIPMTNSYQTIPSYYLNPNMSAQVSQRGLLYNWYAAMNNASSNNSIPGTVQGICPNGWHIPSYSEWTVLMNYVANQPHFRCDDNSNYISKALSSKTTWDSYNSSCTVGWNMSTNNATRFTAMPAGFWEDGYSSMNTNARYWTSTQYNNDQAYYRGFTYNSASVNSTYINKNRGLSVRCLRDEDLANAGDMTVPTVTTKQVTDVTTLSALSGGNVASDGGAVVTQRGICWSTTQNPTIDDEHTTDGSGVGNFSSSITGLVANTTYYVRAYATNAAGTGYGENIVFTTEGRPCADAPTVVDADGNVYNTVQIGQQCWMKENLKVTHNTNGDAIAYHYPIGNASTASTYGLLYTWFVVMNGENASSANPSYVQGICPTGWHLPSKAEWEELLTYVNSQPAYRCGNNSNYIAKALAVNSGWENTTNYCYVGTEQSTNNTTGFSVVPGGYFADDSYSGFGAQAYYWTSTQFDEGNAYRFCLLYNSYSVENTYKAKSSSRSVRCVKD